MFDPIIEIIRGLMNHKSDAPVIAVFLGVILYGLTKFVPKLWLAVSITIALTVALYFPLFYIAPNITKIFVDTNLIGKQWLNNEDLARSVGIGFVIGILFAGMFIYLIVSTIKEMVLRTNPVYILTLRKEPSNKQYMKATEHMITEYTSADEAVLIKKFSITDINYIKNNIENLESIKTAMAWTAAGVPVRRAVKKVKMDAQFN